MILLTIWVKAVVTMPTTVINNIYSMLVDAVQKDIKRHDQRVEKAIQLDDDGKLKEALVMLEKAVDKFGAVLVISRGYELTAVLPIVT